MRTGILSMQRVVNFGSVLQAYTLREMMREVTGEKPVFIDIDDAQAIPCALKIDTDTDFQAPAYEPPGFLGKVKRKLFRELRKKGDNKIRRFAEAELQVSCHGDGELDCLIVGSDEVFNTLRGVNLQLYGNAAGTKRVCSYAGACGSASLEEIPESALPAVRDALKHYPVLSVRDDATKDYLSQLYDGKIVKHMDPVLVGGLRRRRAKAVGLKNYLIVYAYNSRIRKPEEIAAIQSFAKSKGLKTVAVGGVQFWCDMFLPLDPMRMLDYFAAAEYVITDTFHGAIFSVINRKKFGVIERASNANKLRGLLTDLGLTERFVPAMDALEQVVSQQIDYDRVFRLLDAEQKRTEDYLKWAIEQ